MGNKHRRLVEKRVKELSFSEFFSKFSPQIFFSPPKKFSHFHFLCISGCFMPSWVLKKMFTSNYFSPQIFSGWSKVRHNATKHFFFFFFFARCLNTDIFFAEVQSQYIWKKEVQQGLFHLTSLSFETKQIPHRMIGQLCRRQTSFVCKSYLLRKAGLVNCTPSGHAGIFLQSFFFSSENAVFLLCYREQRQISVNLGMPSKWNVFTKVDGNAKRKFNECVFFFLVSKNFDIILQATAFKRPITVIRDLFTNSVLDISWCVVYFLSVCTLLLNE